MLWVSRAVPGGMRVPWSEQLCVSEEKAWLLGAQRLSVTEGDSILPVLPERRWLG